MTLNLGGDRFGVWLLRWLIRFGLVAVGWLGSLGRLGRLVGRTANSGKVFSALLYMDYWESGTGLWAVF